MDLFQMDFFIYILILMLIVGAGFVIYGIITKKDVANVQLDDGEELFSLAQKLETLESSVYEADEAVHMLGDMTKNVFKEFDSKYQELLFLYNLVDEKQKTLALTGSADAGHSNAVQPVIVSDAAPDTGAVVPRPKSKAKQKAAAVSRPVAVSHVALPTVDIMVDDSSSKSPSVNPKFAHVLQLSQEGRSVEEIARELDMGKGEIMLILNLGGRRQNA